MRRIRIGTLVQLLHRASWWRQGRQEAEKETEKEPEKEPEKETEKETEKQQRAPEPNATDPTRQNQCPI